MRKLKKLKLEKTVITNLQNEEMNVLKGGQTGHLSCKPCDYPDSEDIACKLWSLILNDCDKPAPKPQSYVHCPTDGQTCGNDATCYGQTCNPETSAPCTYEY